RGVGGRVPPDVEPPPRCPTRGAEGPGVSGGGAGAAPRGRKTLRAALAGWAGSAAEAENRLTAAGIAPTARGETLDTAAFVRLAQQG
ncbi:hypothetical protein ACFXO7_19475, partial [Nocardia tengchongensis]